MNETGTDQSDQMTSQGSKRKTPLWQKSLPWLITAVCFGYLYTKVSGAAASLPIERASAAEQFAKQTPKPYEGDASQAPTCWANSLRKSASHHGAKSNVKATSPTTCLGSSVGLVRDDARVKP